MTVGKVNHSPGKSWISSFSVGESRAMHSLSPGCEEYRETLFSFVTCGLSATRKLTRPSVKFPVSRQYILNAQFRRNLSECVGDFATTEIAERH
jgi:hypothetical protein